jgi:predicted membrane protein
MIQRKQSVFLLLAVILGVLIIVNYPMWPLFLLALVASSLSFFTIFKYKRRPLQARLSILAAILFVLWYPAVMLVNKFMMSTGLQYDIVNVWGALLAVSAILCLMARKGIMDDERLVRAADRIR